MSRALLLIAVLAGGCNAVSKYPADAAIVDVLDGPPVDLPPPPPLPACHPPVNKQCADGWCIIPAGCFNMGSPPSEPCRALPGYGKETLHQVTLTRRFEISQYEVTQKKYETIVGINPSAFTSCGPSCPVEGVSWHEAAAYCNELSLGTGRTPCYDCGGGECTIAAAFVGKISTCMGYRLPTEAEWEYAFRAGTTTPFHTGPIVGTCEADANADRAGWTDINALGRTHPVGEKEPNGWGLYDMSGNVWEWVNDSFQQDLGAAAVTDPEFVDKTINKVLRGGCYDTDAGTNRAAGLRRYRDGHTVDPRYLGFRPVRTLP